jgi:hypothetical protein
MNSSMRACFAAFLAAAALGSGPASAEPPAREQPVTNSLQGNPGNAAWKSDPYLHALYDLSLGAFANGPDNIDLPAYQQAFYAIIRAKAAVSGADAEKMVDHIKGIPGQMIGIVMDEPKTLESYDDFVAALVGPR